MENSSDRWRMKVETERSEVMPEEECGMGGNNGRWWLLNSDGDLPPPLRTPDAAAVLFLARQDTTIVTETRFGPNIPAGT